MTGRPLILVEGKDDISFYDKISQQANKRTKIIAIENVKGYSEGCEELIKATIDFQEKLNEEEINSRFLLSIIDADVRRLRGAVIDLPCLLILKYYSYESHFITPTNLNRILTQVTSVSHDLLDDKIETFCFDEFKNGSLDTLFLFSLEALKNAMIKDYDGLVGYKYLPNTEKKVTVELLMNHEKLIQEVKAKEVDLLHFASENDINYDYESLKLICKGKWLHGFYSHKLNDKIQELPQKCKENVIKQCQYCSNESYDKCLYKPKINTQPGILKELSLNLLDVEEVNYIIDRFKQLN